MRGFFAEVNLLVGITGSIAFCLWLKSSNRMTSEHIVYINFDKQNISPKQETRRAWWSGSQGCAVNEAFPRNNCTGNSKITHFLSILRCLLYIFPTNFRGPIPRNNWTCLSEFPFYYKFCGSAVSFFLRSWKQSQENTAKKS